MPVTLLLEVHLHSWTMRVGSELSLMEVHFCHNQREDTVSLTGNCWKLLSLRNSRGERWREVAGV